MKKALQKISAAFLALAMIVSLTPVTGFRLLADETESEAPAATEEKDNDNKEPSEKPDAGKQKETEKPAEKKPEETEAPKAETPKETVTNETETPEETKKPEADEPGETTKPADVEPEETEIPKETEKSETPDETTAPQETEKTEPDTPEETEAPKETEKPDTDTPAETEEPKATVPETTEPSVPEDSSSSGRKNATVGTITNPVVDSEGILTWDEYKDAEVSFYNVLIHQGNFETGEEAKPDSFNLHSFIDYLIKSGTIEKKSPYTIKIVAYDDSDELVAQCTFTHEYNSSAEYKPAGALSASIKNGILSWNAYPDPDTDHYWVYIEDEYDSQADFDEYYGEDSYSMDLRKKIDFAIRAGYIQNSTTYKISMVAEDDEGICIGRWSGTTFKYNSSATPITVGTIQNAVLSKEGILTWDPYDGAVEYQLTLIFPDDTWELESSSSASYNLGETIDHLIKNRQIKKSSAYTVEIRAMDEDGLNLALLEQSFTYETNAEPIPVGKVNASISSTGVLTWKAYNDAVYYDVSVDGYELFFSATDTFSLALKPMIDKLISVKVIEKSKTYTISIVARNEDGLKVGEWSKEYSYTSNAVPTDPVVLNAAITDGFISWKACPGAANYEISIDDNWGKTYSKPATFNINKQIDYMIRDGLIDKSSTYNVRIDAYDSYGFVIGYWSTTYSYNSGASLVVPGTVKNIVFSNGRMSWDTYPDAHEYCVAIGESGWEDYVTAPVYRINDVIDKMIKSGDLDKISKYSLSVKAFDSDGVLIAEGHADYSYDSPAEPVVLGSMTAKITNGILTWDKYEGAVSYFVYIDEMPIDVQGDSFNVNKRIDWLIKAGELTKAKTYEVAVAAEDEQGTTLAYWMTDYAYNSNAAPVKPGKITGVKFSKGTMTWTAFKNAAYYMVYVYDCPTHASKNSIAINSKIDWFIKAGQIIKNDPYPIMIAAFDKEDIMIASWDGDYKYESNAYPIEPGTVSITGINADGIMSWEMYPNADSYVINVDDCYIQLDSKGSSCDLKGFVCDLINMGRISRQSSYHIYIRAFTSDSVFVADGYCSYKFTAGTDISKKVTVTGIKDSIIYDGNNHIQQPVIELNGTTLEKGKDYELYYSSIETAGTASLLISFRHNYIGAINITYEIKKASNPLSVKGKTYKVKAKKIKKKSKAVSIASVVKFIKNAGDPKIYKKKSGNKKIVINPKNGVVTIKKKLKKGTYKVKVYITGQGNINYEKSGSKLVTFKIKVK